MGETTYKVILLAGVQESQDFDAVVTKLAGLINFPEGEVVAFLKQQATVIKQSLDLDAAKKYQSAINLCGANCIVKPEVESHDALLEKNKSKKNKKTAADIYQNINAEHDSDFVSQREINDRHKKSRVPAFFAVAALFGLGLWWWMKIGWPAYQHYSVIAQLEDDFELVYEVRDQVTAYIHRAGVWPESNSQVGLDGSLGNLSIESITIGSDSVVSIVFREAIVGEKKLLKYVPKSNDHEVMWVCGGGDLQNEFRPLGCMYTSMEKELGTQFTTLGIKGGKERLVVPSYWSATVHLSNEARIQAESEKDDSYAMVIVQDKVEEENLSIVAYGEVVVEKMFTSISEPRVLSGPIELSVDGKNANRYVVQGVIEKVGVTYIVTIVESELTFYQIFVWTLTSGFEKNRLILETISNGFYETDELTFFTQ